MIRCNSAIFLLVCLAGCQPVWISPYSADLQKRATDMLGQVSAWEALLAQTSDTSSADPALPAAQARLAGWVGDVEAMAAIESSIDPHSAGCDKVLAKISGGLAGPCESLPDIFATMRTELVQRIPIVLGQQCKAGQSLARFKAGCTILFTPTQSVGLKARHGILFTPLITELDSVIYREGRQAPAGK